MFAKKHEKITKNHEKTPFSLKINGKAFALHGAIVFADFRFGDGLGNLIWAVRDAFRPNPAGKLPNGSVWSICIKQKIHFGLVTIVGGGESCEFFMLFMKFMKNQ